MNKRKTTNKPEGLLLQTRDIDSIRFLYSREKQEIIYETNLECNKKINFDCLSLAFCKSLFGFMFERKVK